MTAFATATLRKLLQLRLPSSLPAERAPQRGEKLRIGARELGCHPLAQLPRRVARDAGHDPLASALLARRAAACGRDRSRPRRGNLLEGCILVELPHRRDLILELAPDRTLDGMPAERVLRAEVVVDGRDVGIRRVGDVAQPDGILAVCSEEAQRRLHKPPARTFARFTAPVRPRRAPACRRAHVDLAHVAHSEIQVKQMLDIFASAWEHQAIV